MACSLVALAFSKSFNFKCILTSESKTSPKHSFKFSFWNMDLAWLYLSKALENSLFSEYICPKIL